ncbi:hypothetical protein JTB14_001158 [Gonioctena quinquepunctata]|nr:hypothetical protein JTB14_001158 [Gonioctena quinquepunctata]
MLHYPATQTSKTSTGLLKQPSTKLGGKDGLKKQGKRKGEVAIMIHSLGFPDNDGNVKHIARSIYYPITGDEGERVEVEDETLFQAMEKIKSHMVRQKKTAPAVPELDGIEGILFTRILEYIFADSEVQITMYGLERKSKQPRRSQAIARTPPRHRALSLDDSDFRRPGREDEKENKPAKRKKPNGTPMPGVSKEKENAFLTIFEEFTLQLILQTEILNSHALKLRPDEATCGTPGDDAQKQLLKQNDQLRNEIVALKAAVAISRVHQTANTTLLEDNEELSQEIDQLKKEIISLKTTAERHQESNTEDKCAECMKTQLLQRRKRQLKQDESFTSFQAVSEDDWGSGMFEKPLTQKGYIWEAPSDWDIILPCNSDIESQYKEVGRAIEKFGGKHILKNQNRKEGEVAMMTHTLDSPMPTETSNKRLDGYITQYSVTEQLLPMTTTSSYSSLSKRSKHG